MANGITKRTLHKPFFLCYKLIVVKAKKASRTVLKGKNINYPKNIFFKKSLFYLVIFLVNTGRIFLWPLKSLFFLPKKTAGFLGRFNGIKNFFRNFIVECIKSLKIKPKTHPRIFLKTLKFLTNKAKTSLYFVVYLFKKIVKLFSLFFLNCKKTFDLFVNFFSHRDKPQKTTRLKNRGVIYASPFYFWQKIKFLLTGVVLTVVLLVFPLTMFYWLSELPNPKLLSSRDIPLTTKIYDRNGVLLYQIYNTQNRSYISLKSLPDHLIKATIAIEDKKFYRHKGIDVFGIVRAAVVNVSTPNHGGRPLQGGSSITQQLIKNALLNPEPTISRKVKEIVLAIWAEMIYSKDQILEMYFNQVPYGGTAWGVEAAAETYFKKKASDLSLSESALLAGLPAAPSLYSPFGARPELAKERQVEVLRRMVEDGYLTKENADMVKIDQLKYASPEIEIKAPHFVMYVKDLLVKKYGIRMVEQGGLNVVTSLDLNIQHLSEKIVFQEVEKLKNLLVGNGAALVVQPQTGEVLAMVGSKNYFDLNNDGNVNVVTALRQPGSSIKPVMYAAALQKGYTPATIIDDSAVAFQVSGQPAYIPVNYDGKFHGKVTLRSALANSYNIPAVKVLNSIGLDVFIDLGKKMGITTWSDKSRFGLSLTLGGGEVTMLDLATAYGVFAAGGRKHDPVSLLKVTDYKGNILEKYEVDEGERVLPQYVAKQISSILSDNAARLNAFGPNSALEIKDKTVSVKTGTTNEKRDNWTIGYTPSYLVVVWVGNNDNSPMHPYLSSGITGAAPIWHNIMVGLLTSQKDEKTPESNELISVKVCAWNGLLPCDGCPIITEYFLRGTEPKNHCRISPTPTITP